MNRLLFVSALVLSSAAWADVPPGGGCDCSSSSGVPLVLLAVLAVWTARQR